MAAEDARGLVLNTGRSVPAVGFGTGTSFFGRGAEVAEVVGHAFQAGFTSFDTAVIYGTEAGLGRGLAGLSCPRAELYLTTKTPDWTWSREGIVKDVESSLALLQVAYLDLVLLHTPAPRTDSPFLQKATTQEQRDRLPNPQDREAMEAARLEAWRGLEDCVAKGIVRDIGVSNFTVAHLGQLVTREDVKIRPSVNQVEFNPHQTDPELYQFCQKEGILLQAFAPLGNGKELLDDPVLVEIAKKKGKTPAQVCLRWARQMGVATVTKTERIPRLAENLDIWGWRLEQEEMEAVSGLNKNIRRFGDYSRFP